MNAYSRAALLSVSLLTLVLRAPVSRAQTVSSSPLPVTTNVTQQVGPTPAALSVAVHAPLPAATSVQSRGNAGLGCARASSASSRWAAGSGSRWRRSRGDTSSAPR